MFTIAMEGGDGGVKRCSLCGEEKSRSDFHRLASARDGLQWRCKTCRGKGSEGKGWRGKGVKKRVARVSGGALPADIVRAALTGRGPVYATGRRVPGAQNTRTLIRVPSVPLVVRTFKSLDLLLDGVMECYAPRRAPDRRVALGKGVGKEVKGKHVVARVESQDADLREKVKTYLAPFWLCRKYLELRRTPGRDDWGLFFVKNVPVDTVVDVGNHFGQFTSGAVEQHSSASRDSSLGVVTRRGRTSWEEYANMTDEQKEQVRGVSGAVHGFGTFFNHGCSDHAHFSLLGGWNEDFVCVKAGKKDQEALVCYSNEETLPCPLCPNI